jgi:hypothetical protein
VHGKFTQHGQVGTFSGTGRIDSLGMVQVTVSENVIPALAKPVAPSVALPRQSRDRARLLRMKPSRALVAGVPLLESAGQPW